VLNDALVEGMRIVGIDFRDGILFVPEVLLAANSMKGGMEILRPLLAETGVEPIGKIVIGTVKGDIHDIGKNLVSMMLEGAASRSSISASTTRSRNTWTRSRSTSPTSSACRRC
jgi:methanogenic corrinoid protein MtbC1